MPHPPLSLSSYIVGSKLLRRQLAAPQLEKFYNELYESDGYVIKTIDDNGLFEVAHSTYNDNPNQLHVMVRYDGGDDDNLDQSRFAVRYDGGDIITCDFTCTSPRVKGKLGY